MQQNKAFYVQSTHCVSLASVVGKLYFYNRWRMQIDYSANLAARDP